MEFPKSELVAKLKYPFDEIQGLFFMVLHPCVVCVY